MYPGKFRPPEPGDGVVVPAGRLGVSRCRAGQRTGDGYEELGKDYPEKKRIEGMKRKVAGRILLDKTTPGYH